MAGVLIESPETVNASRDELAGPGRGADKEAKEMFLRRLILVVALILLVLPALALVSLAASDLAPFRGMIETVASRLVGRQVAINGGTVFDVLPRPHLAASAVTVAGVGEIASIDLLPGLASWRPRIDGTIDARSIDLRPFLGTTKPDQTQGEQHPLFSDRPLPLSSLRRLDGRLRITAAHLILTHGSVDAVKVTATLKDGHLELDPVSAGVAGGTLDGKASLDASGASAAALTLNGHHLASDQLLALAGRPGLLAAPIDLAAGLRSSGASPAALAAGLDGHAAMTAGAGRIIIQGMGQLEAALRQAGLIENALQLSCAAIDMKAQAGVLTPAVAVVRTEHGRVTLSGKIDLGRESLDLTLLPKLTGTGLDLTLPVDVSGSFQQPKVAVDKSAAAGRLFGQLGGSGPPAAAQGTLTGLDGANDCLAGGSSDGTAPASDKGVADQVRKGVTDQIRSGVKGLLGK